MLNPRAGALMKSSRTEDKGGGGCTVRGRGLVSSSAKLEQREPESDTHYSNE